jgi:hypothetical protein
MQLSHSLLILINLNVVFTKNLLKMAPIRVRFSLGGFLSGAGFPGEQFAPAWF